MGAGAAALALYVADPVLIATPICRVAVILRAAFWGPSASHQVCNPWTLLTAREGMGREGAGGPGTTGCVPT